MTVGTYCVIFSNKMLLDSKRNPHFQKFLKSLRFVKFPINISAKYGRYWKSSWKTFSITDKFVLHNWISSTGNSWTRIKRKSRFESFENRFASYFSMMIWSSLKKVNIVNVIRNFGNFEHINFNKNVYKDPQLATNNVYVASSCLQF